jgi:iron complex transport system permease protein
LKKILLVLLLLISLFLSLFIFIPEGIKGDKFLDFVLEIRLPEIISATLIGISLSISGLIFQIVLRNDLADPYIIGISGGSAFGLTLSILIFGGMGGAFFFRATSSFFLGFLTLFLIIKVSKGIPEKLLLLGILTNTAFAALSRLFVLYLKPLETTTINSILVGFVAPLDTKEIIFSSFLVLLSLSVTMFYLKEVDILSFSDDEAKSLGVNIEKVRLILILCASLLSATAVSIGGMIGFVGLIVPHLARLFKTTEFKKLFFISLLLGPSIVLLAQTLTKISSFKVVVPVGLYINFVGIIFFIFLFVRKSSNGS